MAARRKATVLKPVNCHEEGLLLDDGKILPWKEIEVIGKTEYPGREGAWATYYLRTKDESTDKKLSTLGQFSLFRNELRERTHRRLKLKIIDYARKQSHIQFVIRTTLFGKERLWDLNKELAFDRYLDSPLAQERLRDFKRQAPILFLIFGSVLGLLLLLVFLFSRFGITF